MRRQTAGSGARGGANLFKWDSVKDDPQKAVYLGHSVMAPNAGRRGYGASHDVNWYSKEASAEDKAEKRRIRRELRLARETEERNMALALGLPPPRPASPSSASVSSSSSTSSASSEAEAEAEAAAAAEKKKKKKRKHHSKKKKKHKKHRGETM